MSVFHVDSERVAAAAATASRSAAALGAEADALMAHLRALDDCWSGGAATSFQHIVHEWSGVQKQVHGSLERIQLALQSAGRQYAEVEAQNARLFAH